MLKESVVVPEKRMGEGRCNIGDGPKYDNNKEDADDDKDDDKNDDTLTENIALKKIRSVLGS